MDNKDDIATRQQLLAEKETLKKTILEKLTELYFLRNEGLYCDFQQWATKENYSKLIISKAKDDDIQNEQKFSQLLNLKPFDETASSTTLTTATTTATAPVTIATTLSATTTTTTPSLSSISTQDEGANKAISITETSTSSDSKHDVDVVVLSTIKDTTSITISPATAGAQTTITTTSSALKSSPTQESSLTSTAANSSQNLTTNNSSSNTSAAAKHLTTPTSVSTTTDQGTTTTHHKEESGKRRRSQSPDYSSKSKATNNLTTTTDSISPPPEKKLREESFSATQAGIDKTESTDKSYLNDSSRQIESVSDGPSEVNLSSSGSRNKLDQQSQLSITLSNKESPTRISKVVDPIVTPTLINAENQKKQIFERAKHEAAVTARIAELRKQGLWSAKRLPKLQEPPRPKTHWDYLLEEMKWLSSDFDAERKWKRKAAKKCALMVYRYHQEKRSKIERAEREHLQNIRRIASAQAKEIRSFWSSIEKIVDFRQQTKLEETRKKAWGQHLNYILDQTSKFSNTCLEDINTKSTTKDPVEMDYILSQDGENEKETPVIKVSRNIFFQWHLVFFSNSRQD